MFQHLGGSNHLMTSEGHMTADEILRTCPTCGEKFFSKSTLKCKPCAKAYNARWHAANRERVATRIKAQRSSDPEKYAAMCMAWREANPGKVVAISRAYYQANRDRLIEISKEWQRRHPEEVVARNAAAYRNQDHGKRNADHAAWIAANPEKRRAWSSAWRAAHPENKKISHQNRRARKKIGGGKLSQGLIQKLLKLQRGKCACCGKPLGKDYHLDHRVPLARGGAHADENMQLLTSKCNMQKGAKNFDEFMRARGFLI